MVKSNIWCTYKICDDSFVEFFTTRGHKIPNIDLNILSLLLLTHTRVFVYLRNANVKNRSHPRVLLWNHFHLLLCALNHSWVYYLFLHCFISSRKSIIMDNIPLETFPLKLLFCPPCIEHYFLLIISI